MTTPPAAGPAVPGVVCPTCGVGRFAALPGDPAWYACSSCGHRAAPAYLFELAALDAWLAASFSRHDWLTQRVAASDPGFSPTSRAPAASSAGAGTQNLLLGLGGLLLSLAGLFFTAVAWSVLGASARLLLLATIGGSLAGLGIWVKSRVRAAAETLSVVGAALIATAAYAAPSLGAFGAGAGTRNDLPWYVAASVLLTFGNALGLRVSRLRAWVFSAAATGCAAAVLAGLQLADQTHDPLWFTGVTALVGTGLSVTPALLGPTWAGAAIRGWVSAELLGTVRTAWSISTIVLMTGAGLSTALWLTQQERVVAYSVALVVLGGIGPLVHLADPSLVRRECADVTAGTLVGASAVLLLSGAPRASAPNLTAVVLAGVLLVAVSVTNQVRGTLALPAAGVLVVGALIMPVAVDGSYPSGQVAAFFAVGALALLATAFFGRVALAPASRSPFPTSVPPIRTVWELAAWPAGGFASLAWFIYWGGEIHPGEHTWAETYTAPAAACLLIAGAVWSYRRRQAAREPVGTAATLLPGLLMLLVPAGFLALGVSYSGAANEALVRSVVLIAGGSALIAAGARMRIAAFVISGTVAVAFGTVGHLVAFSDLLPRWVSLAASGLLLLAVGARWEWLRTRRADARIWVGALR